MRAAILHELNAPLAVEEVECGALEFGQVRVRVLCSGICGAQLQEIRGEKGGPLPHLLGHEGCGIVEEIGVGVSRVAVGAKVVMHWRKAAGIESPLPRYKIRGEWRESGRVTTFAEQSICSENRLTPVPPDTDPELCALLGCSLSTALGTVEQEARWGDNALVVGAGGLGMAMLASIHLGAPATVCCCDIHESKRDSTRPHVDRYFNLVDEPLTGSYDVIYDTAGAVPTTEDALQRLAPGGRYVMIGQPPPEKPVCIRWARHMFDGEGKSIRATQGGGFRPDMDIPRYLAIADQLFTGNLITHRMPLDRINGAISLVQQGEAGRVLLQISDQ